MKRPFLFFFFSIIAIINVFPQTEKVNSDEYKPVVFGILKTKAEYDLENLKLRFEVRNARFGAKGKINPYFSYKAEIDLSDEGKIKMLDAYVKFTPVSGLDFYMGQRKIPFSTDYIRSPAENIFANRSFLAKFINDGMRDIGFFANYKPKTNLPIDITLGGVNGTGNNNPQWIKKPNLAGRVLVGHDDGFRVASNIYFGEATDRNHLAMYGEEIRWVKDQFFIESEYISRNWTDTLSIRNHDHGFYIHSYYNFKVNNSLVCLLTPTARWDIMGSSVFKGATNADRITLGINIGFVPKQFTAEIRLNYENYFKSSLPIETDKITIEFVAQF